MSHRTPTRRVAAVCTLLAFAASPPARAAADRPLVDPSSVSVRYATAAIDRDGEPEAWGPGLLSSKNFGPIRANTVPSEDGGSVMVGFSGPVMHWSAVTPESGAAAEFEARYAAGAQSERWGNANFPPDVEEIRGAIAIDVFEPVRVRIEAVAGCTARGGAFSNTSPELAEMPSSAGGLWSASFEPADPAAENPCPMLTQGSVFVGAADERDEKHTAEASYVYLRPGSYVVRTKITSIAGGFGFYPETVAPAAHTFMTLNMQVLTSCPADLNRDGIADLNDLASYIDLWSAADPEADISGSAVACDKRSALPDGRTDMIDLNVYLNLWLAEGCAN